MLPRNDARVARGLDGRATLWTRAGGRDRPRRTEGEDRIQHFIGVVLGAARRSSSFDSRRGDTDRRRPDPGYLIAVVVGAIVALLWPWVIGIVLVRRARRTARSEQIHDEVAKARPTSAGPGLTRRRGRDAPLLRRLRGARSRPLVRPRPRHCAQGAASTSR